MSRPLLATCVAAAARAAEIIRERSRDHRSLEWETKARADFVTDVDRSAAPEPRRGARSVPPPARVARRARSRVHLLRPAALPERGAEVDHLAGELPGPTADPGARPAPPHPRFAPQWLGNARN
jgi:hypothetical protein